MGLLGHGKNHPSWPLSRGNMVDNSMPDLPPTELEMLISAIAEVIEEQYGYGEGEEFITPYSSRAAVVLAERAVGLWRQRSPYLFSGQDFGSEKKVD